MARTLSDRSKESRKLRQLDDYASKATRPEFTSTPAESKTKPLALSMASTSTSTSTSAPVSTSFGFAPAPPTPVFQTPVPLSHVIEKNVPPATSAHSVQPQPPAQPEQPQPTVGSDQLVVPEPQEAMSFDLPSPFMRPHEIEDQAEEAEVEGLVLARVDNIVKTSGVKGGRKKSVGSLGTTIKARGTGVKVTNAKRGKAKAIMAKQGASIGNHPNPSSVAARGRGRGRGRGAKAVVGKRTATSAGAATKVGSSTKATAAKNDKAKKVEAVPAQDVVPQATTSVAPAVTTIATPAAAAIEATPAAVEQPVAVTVAETEMQTQGRSKRARRVEPGRYAEPASPPPKKMRLGKGPKKGRKRKYDDDEDDEDKKRYVCTQPGCDKSFARNFNLNAHLDTHRGIRDYACHECGKLFSRRHDCTRHCVAVHNVDREKGKLEVLRVTPERAPHQKPGVQRQPSPFATSEAWANSGLVAARASGAGARKRKSNALNEGKEAAPKAKKGKKVAVAGKGKAKTKTGGGKAAQRFKRNAPNGHGSQAAFKTTGLPIRGRPRKTLAA